jgi:hypothetical protein
MKITINLTKKEIEHLIDGNCTTYLDACSTIEDIMRKVINKIK